MPSTQTTTATDTKPREDVEQPRSWNVVLLNDDDHSVQYVVRMMQELFGHPPEKGLKIASTVDKQGRAVCLTTHKEHAELKRDQIHAYGRDAMTQGSKGSMSAIIEPADFGDDDEGAGGEDQGGDGDPS